MHMHPYLNTVLVEQRRQSCPCGSHTARPGTLCQKCRHAAMWRRHKGQAKRPARTTRRAGPDSRSSRASTSSRRVAGSAAGSPSSAARNVCSAMKALPADRDQTSSTSALSGPACRKETGRAFRAVPPGAKPKSEAVMQSQTEDFVSSLLGLVLCAANVSFVVLLLS